MSPSAEPSFPSQTGTYADYLAEMVDWHLTLKEESASMERILLAIGVPTVCRGHHHFEVRGPEVQREDQPSENFISKTLIAILHHHVQSVNAPVEDSVSILGGLMQRDRWIECLKDLDTTYAFASLLAHAMGVLENDSATLYVRDDIGAIYQPGLCAMLNAWIVPDAPYTCTPSMDSFTRTLFGDAWCDLARHVPRSHPRGVISCIMTLRPPILGHMAPAQIEVAPLDLPSMTC